MDLAWGERGRTGLAALDASGRLVASGSVRSDDEIAEFVAEHTTGTLVAAVDAPLVVPDAAGRRGCEASVSAAFGRFHAGAYPTNRGLPAFRDGPRAARLAARLGWTDDPAVRPGPGRRVCIEVYPHPAMVVLFGLDRVIPYKRRPGRDLASLRTAFERLLGHLEHTCGPVLRLADSPRWAELRRLVAAADRPARLAAVEDELDAVLCAYLAWLWRTDPAGLVVHGDRDSGHIVTPPAPVPAPTPDPVGRRR